MDKEYKGYCTPRQLTERMNKETGRSVTFGTVSFACRQGRITARQIDGRWLIPKAEADRAVRGYRQRGSLRATIKPDSHTVKVRELPAILRAKGVRPAPSIRALLSACKSGLIPAKMKGNAYAIEKTDIPKVVKLYAEKGREFERSKWAKAETIIKGEREKPEPKQPPDPDARIVPIGYGARFRKIPAPWDWAAATLSHPMTESSGE